jgi:hypothetical protein
MAQDEMAVGESIASVALLGNNLSDLFTTRQVSLA